MLMQSWISLFGTKKSRQPKLCAPPSFSRIPAQSATSCRIETSDGDDPFAAFEESNQATATIPTSRLTRLPLAQQISRWLNLLSRQFNSFVGSTKRRNRWRLFYASAFECLEPRLCLSYEPVAQICLPSSTIQAGDSLTLNGSGSMSSMDMDAPPPGVLHFSWGIASAGGVYLLGIDNSVVTITWDDLKNNYGFAKGNSPSPVTIGLFVSDNNGVSSIVTDNLTIAANQIPFANAGGGGNQEYHIHKYESLSLDGSGSYDSDMIDTPTFEWDILDDGTIDSTNQSPTIPWSTLDGLNLTVGSSYQIKLTVRDGLAQSTDYATLFYDNTAPYAAASYFGASNYDIFVDEDLQLNASMSSDPDDAPNPLTYNWDLDNDGQFDDASGETPLVPWTSLGFAAPSSHTIKVKVSDGNLEAIAEATVDVKLPEVSLVFWNGGMFEWKPACINGSLRVYRSGPTTNALPVTLSIPSVMPNILNLATQGSTPGSDYTIASLSVSIPVGEDFVEVPVTVNNDLLVEGDEIVVVRLASSLLYTSSNGEVQGTIVDNDRWDWDYTPPNWGWGTTASYHTWGDGSSLWSYIGAGRESASTVSATVSGDFDPFIGFDRHVELDLELSFDINESTGVITMDTPNPTPGVTQDGSLSCGFGWSVNIDQTTHLATVSFSTLTVYAGGTVTMTAVTPPVYGATIGLESNYNWSYAETVAAIVINLQGKIVESF